MRQNKITKSHGKIIVTKTTVILRDFSDGLSESVSILIFITCHTFSLTLWNHTYLQDIP